LDIENPLHNIEALLGNIETWSSNIINVIFIDDYNPKIVFATQAFFFGNKFSLEFVLDFYRRCNEHNPLLALLHFGLLYKMWKTNTDSTQSYYNMKHKKIMQINRENLPLSETEGEIPLRIDGIGYSESIRARLSLMF